MTLKTKTLTHNTETLTTMTKTQKMNSSALETKTLISRTASLDIICIILHVGYRSPIYKLFNGVVQSLQLR